MTVAELSKRTGLSIGMLSKIENGNTSPSLTTLQSLSRAQRAGHGALPAVRGTGGMRFTPSPVRASRSCGEGTRAGHQYNLLGHLGQARHGVWSNPT
jgi:transcriptional regulator with XRE-family HTH domain